MEIRIKDVTKCFGNTTVIRGVNMELHSGKVYGFQGINGCGKTMLMRLIAGLIYPTEGKVEIDGKMLQGQNSFPESMGLLLENPVFLGQYSGYENLSLLGKIRGKIGKDEVKQAIQRVGLDPSDKKKYRKYSLGMKQRLGIACAIMEAPDLLILDEPLISLDEDGIETTLKIIRQEKNRGALVILACHDYEILADVADEIFRLTAGKVTKHFVKKADDSFKEAEI